LRDETGFFERRARPVVLDKERARELLLRQLMSLES
jgi:hypothetical protein